MQKQAIISLDLEKTGLAKVGRIANSSEVESLASRSGPLLANVGKQWSDYLTWHRNGLYKPCLFSEPGRDSVLVDFIGIDPVIDLQIKTIFQRPQMNKLLTVLLGSNYQPRYMQIRCANPGSRPLRMHRDNPHEVVLCLLLDRVDASGGTTTFIPRSHRADSPWRTLSGIPARPLKPWAIPATGEPGDAYIFHGNILHGRQAHAGRSKLAIIISYVDIQHKHLCRQIPDQVQEILRGRESPR